MTDDDIDGTLAFLRCAERLKDTLRTGLTSGGRAESTAEHTWRLCLMALVFGDQLPGIDAARLLRICLVHDLAEALTGDLPAPVARDPEVKTARERVAMDQLTRSLPERLRAGILDLWEEYEAAATPEAKLAKGFDKLETILQHTQGQHGPGFDIAYNLGYARAATDHDPLLAAIRAKLDADTRARIAADDARARTARDAHAARNALT
jgi:putative hydrolase of HD superfamily